MKMIMKMIIKICKMMIFKIFDNKKVNYEKKHENDNENMQNGDL